MAYQTFAVTAQGESHKKHDNKPAQDWVGHYSGEGMHVAVVADGHGSDNCFRSEHGSKFAVDCALKVIKEFIAGIRETEKKLAKEKKERLTEKELTDRLKSQAVPGIVQSWNIEVDNHYRTNPIDEAEMEPLEVSQKYRDRYLKEARQIKENIKPEGGGLTKNPSGPASRHAYGSTLIVAAIIEDWWFGIHIGDGKLTAFYPDGTYDQPVPWDERCNLNITTSICDDDAAASARVYAKRKNGKPLPMAIFVNSDGIDDSFVLDDNMNHMAKDFYYPVLLMFQEDHADPKKGWDASVKELQEYLPVMSKNGSGDDMSVAGIIDMEAVTAPTFTAKLEEWKKKKEAAKAAQAAAEQAKKEAAEQTTKAETEQVTKATKQAVNAEIQQTAKEAGKASSTGGSEGYRKAAEQGDVKAQCNLGLCYANGRGVAQDYAQAVEWFRKAANQGYAEAQFRLGTCYINGDGVPQDNAKAVEWLHKAVDQRHTRAQHMLDRLKATGKV